MRKIDSCLNLKLPFTCLAALLLTVTLLETPAFTLTASVGRPYQGRLVNGVPFPTQFPGYFVRDQERAYATPEAIGAVLDAIDAVRERYPDTCDLYIGDFSRPGGGPINMHRSHQNGRDADLGMYARGNRPLDTFAPMNEETLDVAKTWCFLESLLRSQHVQYIFLDRRIQRQLHEYALSQGGDPAYLEQVFATGRNSPMQHVGGHYDHMHVRFYTPWSTKAARVAEEDEQQRTAIETAQQAYLPQKVNYYVKGNEQGLEELARSFGVDRKDLCRWNQMNANDTLTPGSCMVFYKRSFEVEPVHLARSLQPDSVPDSPGLQFASVGAAGSLLGVSNSARAGRFSMASAGTYTIHRGDTLQRVAQRNGVDVKVLRELNGLKGNAEVKPGQKIRLVSGKVSSGAAESTGSDIQKSVHAVSVSEPKTSKNFVPAVYTADKQDTLQKIAKQQGIDLNALCQINGLNKNTALKPGQKIRLCEPETSSKTSTGSPSVVKAALHLSPKQSSSSSNTLQKNMKPVPGAATKANASVQKAQGSQKTLAKASATGNSVQPTKAEKKPAKKP
jgi:LysM repeat protein/murein endopeptidase